MALERIMALLEACRKENTPLPPTILYNEGWMLRLTMDWFARHPEAIHPMSIPRDCRWYSEALLPSAFLQRYRGDRFAEAWTHADGAIEHFVVGRQGTGDLSLLPGATHFVVIEAKMFSKLSSGTTRTRYYNQAARNVACLAEALRRVDRRADQMNTLGFYVIAPEAQIRAGIFEKQMNHQSIQATVQRRVSEYDESKEDWFNNWFLPAMQATDIQTMSWEGIIEDIEGEDHGAAIKLKEFYELCLRFNHQVADEPRSRRSQFFS